MVPITTEQRAHERRVYWRRYLLGGLTAERMGRHAMRHMFVRALLEISHTGPTAVMDSNHQPLSGGDHPAVCVIVLSPPLVVEAHEGAMYSFRGRASGGGG